MSAAANPCQYPFDLSGFQGLSFSIAQTYKRQWDTFNRIQSYNLGISTQKSQGAAPTLSYYQYLSYAERNDFTAGQNLHVLRYPNVGWNSVPND